MTRSASVPRGLALLHRGPAECAAAVLGVDVDLVEQARACLVRGPERARLLEDHAFAQERNQREPRPAPAPTGEPRPRHPDDLLRQAEVHPLGVEFLSRGLFETVAITFDVHPDMVLAARELLATRDGSAGTARLRS